MLLRTAGFLMQEVPQGGQHYLAVYSVGVYLAQNASSRMLGQQLAHKQAIMKIVCHVRCSPIEKVQRR